MSVKKILVVDDDAMITRFLKLVLEKTGRYQIRTENKGAAAVSAAAEFLPELIILDVNMPDMDGGVVASQLKAREDLRHIPVVFLTGNVSEEEADAQITIGENSVLAKPINLEKLVDCIERNLSTG